MTKGNFSNYTLRNLILLPNTDVFGSGNYGNIEENPMLHLSFSLLNEEIDSVIEAFYDTYSDKQEKKLTEHQSFLLNEIAINQILERMIFLYTENHPSRDVFVDFLQKEMIIRLI
ncbi:MAG: hypothetical protein JNL70_13195 [Saprospiraceae bacterium]|nr:hypothetical protein [Saprospiraceae bacterium]